MTKFLATALTAAILLPTAAVAGEAPAQKTFTRDGETYVYTAAPKGDGIVLTGRATPSGRDFHLTVRGNRVTGYSGGVPVSFVTESAPAATVLASR